MLISSHVQGLSGYFRQSNIFYYTLVDLQGCYLYANPGFQKMFHHDSSEFYGSLAADDIIQADIAKYKATIQQCLQNPGTPVCADLCMKWQQGSSKAIRWEFSACVNEEWRPECIQAIGVIAGGMINGPYELNKSTAELMERYKAYEQGVEGLWMFELKTPVSATALPEEIIAHCRKNGYLTECNDNMARMYGFGSAEEMIGISLDGMINFDDPARVEYLRTCIQNRFKCRDMETKAFDQSGRTLYFLNNMTGIVENGMLKRVWGTQQDITKQREAEQQLQQSELFYRNLIADSLDGVLLTDINGLIHFASTSITKILGYSPEETVGKNVFDFSHPDDRKIAMATFEDEVKEQPRVKFINIRLLKKDGEWVWCIVRGHNMLANPYVGRVVVYFYDDTLRKRSEQALIDSEKRFRAQATILHNVTDVIVTTDINGIVTSWNKVIEKLTGITEEKAIGKMFRDLLPTNFSPFTHEQVTEIVFEQGIWRGEICFPGSNGEKKYLLHTVSLLYDEEGKNIGLLGVGKDITHRKEAKEKLQESELFYRNLISYSLDGIIMTNKQGRIIYCGPSVRELSGYEPADLLGHHFFEFVHTDDRVVALEMSALVIDKKSSADYVLIRLKHNNGNWTWCRVRGHNLLDNPVFNSVVIYFTNETKRKETEDKLRESEKKFRSLIYNIAQGVVVTNEKKEVIIVNRAALDILSVKEEEVLGTTSSDSRWNAIHEDGRDFPPETHPIVVAAKSRKPVRDIVMGVYRHAWKDRMWLIVNAEPVLDNNAALTNVICSFTDITERKRLSKELVEQEVQKQKLITQATIDGQEKEREEIGKELHDNINQHLTTTRLYLEVAREKASGEVLEMINLSHKNLVSIVHEIRNLSQSLVPPTMGDIGLIESVQDLCDSLKRVHPFHIELQYQHFHEEALPGNMKLMLFRIIQEQVNNILRHANANAILIRLQSDAEYIILTIADDGKGFDPGSNKKGVGFSNMVNRASLFNGKVEIIAGPGKGCTVSVVIPLVLEKR